MATPIEPFDESKTPSIPPPSQDEIAPFTTGERTSMDPAGIWLKFLGPQATVNDVKMFLQGLEKMLQVLVQQNDAAFKRALEAQKRAQQENS